METMDEKLQEKVCFEFLAVSGFVKVHNPLMWEVLFNIDDNFTEEEKATIMSLAEQHADFSDVLKEIEEETNGQD